MTKRPNVAKMAKWLRDNPTPPYRTPGRYFRIVMQMWREATEPKKNDRRRKS